MILAVAVYASITISIILLAGLHLLFTLAEYGFRTVWREPHLADGAAWLVVGGLLWPLVPVVLLVYAVVLAVRRVFHAQ